MYKLEMLNEMKVVESSGSGGELEYVYVEDNQDNIQTIRELGYTGEIEVIDGLIDISVIAFEHTDAKWFQPSLGGFIRYVPDHAPEWAK